MSILYAPIKSRGKYPNKFGTSILYRGKISLNFKRQYGKSYPAGCFRTLEIIDIECVLLAFLGQNFVSTKWRPIKGNFFFKKNVQNSIIPGSN